MIDFASIPKDGNGHPIGRYRVRLGSRSEPAFGVQLHQGVGVASGRALFQMRVHFGELLVIEERLDLAEAIEEEAKRLRAEGGEFPGLDAIRSDVADFTGWRLKEAHEGLSFAVAKMRERGFPLIASEVAKLVAAIAEKIAAEERVAAAEAAQAEAERKLAELEAEKARLEAEAQAEKEAAARADAEKARPGTSANVLVDAPPGAPELDAPGLTPGDPAIASATIAPIAPAEDKASAPPLPKKRGSRTT